jgi:hypothetical protein
LESKEQWKAPERKAEKEISSEIENLNAERGLRE